jgi:hypothetical protein
MDLSASQNTATEFADDINSVERQDSAPSFDIFPVPEGAARSCLGNNTNRVPCDLRLQMPTDPDTPSACRWNYTCDYSKSRFPQYLWKAQCTGNAHPIFYRVPVLTLQPGSETGCLPFTSDHAVYRWEIEMVPVACSCTA